MNQGCSHARSTTLDAQRRDREEIVWSLNSGSTDGDESATARARAQLRGRYTKHKSYSVTDLWQRSAAEAGDAVGTITQMELWSKAYASFFLNGFDLLMEGAEFAIERLQSASLKNNSVAARIITTHERLAHDLHPEHAAAPESIAVHVATWPEEIFPQDPWAAHWLSQEIRDQNAILVEENARLRKIYSDAFNKSGVEVKRRAVKSTSLDRAHVYMVLLARRLFPEVCDNPTGIADEIVRVVSDDLGSTHELSPLRNGSTRRSLLTTKPAMIAAVQSGFKAIGLNAKLSRGPADQTK